MATLAKLGNAHLIQFYPDGQSSVRKGIYLGGRRYSEITARELKRIVEKLIFCRDNDSELDKKTLAWLEATTPEIRQKLATAGLVDIPEQHTLGELWDSFIKTKESDSKAGKIKEATVSQYDHAKRRFFEFFKETDILSDLSKEMLLKWKTDLLKQLQTATVASTLKHAKSVFTWAVDQGWITESPLTGIGRGDFRNKKNDRYIKMGEYYKLLDSCPCQDWRTIIALARIGGLRCPSEVLALKWEDVNWEQDRFYVRSPKTEHHEGGEGRWVPLFPELKSEMETLFFLPKSEGTEFIINRYRDVTQNLRTTFDKIVKRAGLPTIPRPFDNMRATRSNEVHDRWGTHKESEWIGHTARVRKDHYGMITDDDYTAAAQWEIYAREPVSPKSERQTEPEKRRLKSMVAG